MLIRYIKLPSATSCCSSYSTLEQTISPTSQIDNDMTCRYISLDSTCFHLHRHNKHHSVVRNGYHHNTISADFAQKKEFVALIPNCCAFYIAACGGRRMISQSTRLKDNPLKIRHPIVHIPSNYDKENCITNVATKYD